MSPTEPSYVVLGTTPWSAPWLTEQNLAHALSARHRVLYVEPPMSPLTPFRYGLGPTVRQQLARARDRGVRRCGDVFVHQPLALPLRRSRRLRELSTPMLAAQLSRAVDRLGLERPVLVSGEAAPGLVGAARERLAVYIVKDWVDADGHLLGRSGADLVAERDAMCERADVVCAISPQLQAGLAHRGFESALLRHGFHDDLADRYDAPAPPEYGRLPRPLLGFAGRLDGRLDIDLLCAVADRFASGSLLLIGPITPRFDRSALDGLLARPNVHHLGPFDRTELPPYLAHLDCSLVPYLDSEWARHGSPLKLWDYLYAGAPIVGSGYSILRDFEPDLARFATTHEEFIAAIERALDEPATRREQRRAFAAANTWRSRAEQLEELVAERLAERERPGTRVAVFPYAQLANPYQRLLYEALEPHGVRVLPPARLDRRWARRARGELDVVHLHWIEWLTSSNRQTAATRLLAALVRSGRLLSVLAGLRRRGVRVVWTVHNLGAHEPRLPRLERAVSRAVAGLCDELVVHSEYAARRVADEYRVATPIRVAHHGHYADVYPDDPRSREEIRAALGLPAAAFTYLIFGYMRAYKRVPEAIRAFSRLADPDVRLVVAGAAHPDVAEAVREAAAADERVLLHEGVVADEDVAAYHRACDAAILNYRDVFSSGALLLALSFGLPVVAPAGGMTDEIAAPPAIVTFAPDGLTSALEAIRDGDQALRRQAAREQALAYPWSRTAAELLPAYGIESAAYAATDSSAEASASSTDGSSRLRSDSGGLMSA